MARHNICNNNNQTITSTNSSGNGTVTGIRTTTTTTAAAATEGQRPVVTLKFLTSALVGWVDAVAERFNAERPDVIVEVVSVPLAELAPNIINEATSKTGLFDGFVTPPTVMGSIVQEDGWADLRPYIESTAKATADWSDIFLSYRKWISQYQNKILMYPLDGDLMSMFYRADILEEFGLNVPRTWDEYNEVAAATHGKTSKRTNQTLIGSCVGRVPGCAGAYFANLVLSSMTQLDGFSQGHLFDTSTMNPLLGEAFTQMLEWMEIQVKYGPPDQFEHCIDLTDRYMNQGTCVLTYNWGNTFKVYLNEGSIFATDSGAKMGVAPTPGSPRVLDRDSMKLVPCDQNRCRFARYYKDIGWVNSAPYLAFGGW
jgi:multiple sugar transport system substrate-binding protein